MSDHVYLQVSLMKGVRRFGIKGKLAPRYIGSYPIIDKYEPTSYQVELPAKLLGVHNVFYVSQLKRCLKPPTDVVIEGTIPLEPDLTYKANPIKVLDQQDQVTRNKTTRFYKIQWNDHSKDKATKPGGSMKNSCDPTTRVSPIEVTTQPSFTFYAFTSISG
jgi:hypothetical protein